MEWLLRINGKVGERLHVEVLPQRDRANFCSTTDKSINKRCGPQPEKHGGGEVGASRQLPGNLPGCTGPPLKTEDSC
ncbi:unnamed protein product [Pleuronectes platessa]|uniref:Uncharacterized protein n=1 Tax=Pleuronectes platessa TaxID=8262 RepID=A0A9N7UBP8_PLEPL|nr:unnamed protein product [Pleuronectes platessa]